MDGVCTFGGSLSNLNKIYSDWMDGFHLRAEAVLPLIRQLFPRWYVDIHPSLLIPVLFSGCFVCRSPELHTLDLLSNAS